MPVDYFARVEEGTIHPPDLASAPPERVLAEYRKGEVTPMSRALPDLRRRGTPSPGYGTGARLAPGFRHAPGPERHGLGRPFDRRAKDLTP